MNISVRQLAIRSRSHLVLESRHWHGSGQREYSPLSESGQLYFPVSEDEIVMTMTRNDQDSPAMLLDVRQIARLLSCSTRHVQRLADAGLMPRSIRLGGRLIRFRRNEVEDWISGGCPRVRSIAGGKRGGFHE